jgi:methyl-accepting chemotaxis protein
MLSYLKTSGFQTITVTDVTGTVLSRPHAPSRTGDDASAKGYVGPAIKGRTALTLEPGTTIALGLFYGFPVKRGNEVVGSIVAGMNIADTAMLERLSAVYGTEFSMFYGDAMVSSTIETGDESAGAEKIGPDIVNAVAVDGKTLFYDMDVAGQRLRSFFEPFQVNDKIVGMLSAGVSTRDLRRTVQNAMWRVALSAILFMSFAVLFSYFFARSVSRPIRRLVFLMKKVRGGDFAIPQSEFRWNAKNEIGEIFLAINEAVRAQAEYIGEVMDSAERVSDNSEDLSHLSSESRKLAERIKKSAADISQISDKTNESVTNATISHIVTIAREQESSLSVITDTTDSLSKSMGELAYRIAAVNTEASDTFETSMGVMGTANKMKDLAASLQETLARFNIA